MAIIYDNILGRLRMADPSEEMPGEGIITITQNGEVKGAFNLNQEANVTIELDGGAAASGISTITVNGTAIPVVNGKAELTLATVALTGSYKDLIDTPELAEVATTGNYSDLDNLPDIGDGVVKLMRDGEAIGQFNLNQDGDIEIDIPDAPLTWNE